MSILYFTHPPNKTWSFNNIFNNTRSSYFTIDLRHEKLASRIPTSTARPLKPFKHYFAGFWLVKRDPGYVLHLIF